MFRLLCFGRRVLIFPKGNNVDHLSMYLDVADSASLPYGWSRYAQFCLGVVNQIHNKYSVRKGTSLDMFSTNLPLCIKLRFFCSRIIISVLKLWCWCDSLSMRSGVHLSNVELKKVAKNFSLS